MRKLLAPVALTALVVWAHGNTVDPVTTILCEFLGHKTIYAAGYSDRRWNAVRIGMSKQDVLRILGKPIEFVEPNDPWRYSTEDRWRYSTWAPQGTESYQRREIQFRQGLVVGTLAEFYLD